MESKKRFRNHISIVLEKLGVLGGIVVAYLIANANTIVDLVSSGMPSENLVSLFFAGMAILMVLMFVVGYHVAVWSRTWISLVDGSIVMERNTLHQRKNTIGIKNISNVNLEQNLLEMLLGTCKVKLDTNSLSTADQTDVKILLKKSDAEAFRAEVMALLKTQAVVSEADVAAPECWDYEATTQDILMHGLFSIRLSVVLIAIGSLAALFVITLLTLRHGAFAESLGSLLVNVLFFGAMAFSALRNLLMGFIKYYGFKIARRGDKLVMHYGLLKKVQYTIPVDTINGIKVRQSFIARLSGRAMAEVINIGLGDDDAEAESFLCPYAPTAHTLAHIRALLPELEGIIDTRFERQPKAVWAVWLCSMVGLALGAVAVAIAGEWLVAYWQQGTILVNSRPLPLDGATRESILLALRSGVVVFVLGMVAQRLARYHTTGAHFGEDHLLLVEGAWQRTYCWISYRKVQYMSLSQGPVSGAFKIQKGRLHILAATRNQVQRMPYMWEQAGDLLKEKILTR